MPFEGPNEMKVWGCYVGTLRWMLQHLPRIPLAPLFRLLGCVWCRMIAPSHIFPDLMTNGFPEFMHCVVATDCSPLYPCNSPVLLPLGFECHMWMCARSVFISVFKQVFLSPQQLPVKRMQSWTFNAYCAFFVPHFWNELCTYVGYKRYFITNAFIQGLLTNLYLPMTAIVKESIFELGYPSGISLDKWDDDDDNSGQQKRE
jgi:hypothetical protein